MILVPSRRLPLSGNKLLMICMIVFLGAACGTKKPIVKTPEKTEEQEGADKRVYNPKTGKYELVKKAPVDTVRWTEISEESFPPITSEKEKIDEVVTKDIYNVSMFIPFKTGNFSYSNNNIDSRTSKYINYYAGAKIALKQLESEGVLLTTYVHDSNNDLNTVENLLKRSSTQKADLIIGPYHKEAIVAAAEFGSDKKIPVISPWRPSFRAPSDNPFLVQVNPSFKSHCEAIAQHVTQNFDPTQVVLVSRNVTKERNRFRYFQDANQMYNGVGAESFQELIIEDQSMSLEDTDLTEYIQKGKPTVFIVPYYARAEEEFVHSFLGRLSFFKGEETVYVYGLPHWMDYSKINYDWFETLKIRMSSSNNLNPNDPEIASFKSQFFNEYGTLPSEDAYEGYDLTLHAGRMLGKHGREFVYYLDTEEDDLLQSSFRFQKVGKYSDDFTDYDYLENKKLYIVEFRDSKFQTAR